MSPWLIPVYTAGCALHSYIWNKVANESWEVREGGLTREQLLLKDWNWARLILFVPLWPLVVAATICYGAYGALKELYR